MAHEPQAEEFGLTAEDERCMPEPWVESHRGVLVTAVVAAAFLLLFVTVLAASGSLSAASFLAVVGVAASLIVLLPATTLLVCVLGCAEDRLRTKRDPLWRACAAYRSALSAYQRQLKCGSVPISAADPVGWRRLGRDALLIAMTDRFVGDGWTPKRVENPVREGVDLVLSREDGRRAAVRCEPGPVPMALARVRELVAVRADLGLDDLILVCPGGLEPDARSYATSHGLGVLDGESLAAG